MANDADWAVEDAAWALEEIRTESVLRSMCNCRPVKDGEELHDDDHLCEHGFSDEVMGQTLAEWAKEQLEDWVYEDEDPDEEDMEFDDEEEDEFPSDEDAESDDEGSLLVGGINFGATGDALPDLTSGAGEEGAPKEWHLNEETGEWEER